MRKYSASSLNNLQRFLFWVFCCWVFSFVSLRESWAAESNGKISSVEGQGSGNVGNKLPTQDSQAESTEQNQFYVLDDQENFCQNDPNAPFYQRDSDGAVCCRGKQLPVITVRPETEGECAISTKFGKDGLMDSDSLWCSYTCSLKKLGVMDKDGRVVPEAFLDHLCQGLAKGSRDRIKMIMNKYLGCFQPLKNPDMPCYTPLGFQKCFRDALYFLCTNGMPKNNDFSTLPKIKLEYQKLQPSCLYNQRRVTPGCCHEKPMPWTVAEILEASRNESYMGTCLKELGDQCDASCLLKSLNVVNDEWDLDVEKFQANILKSFPMVKASAWMDYTGPVFLFYDEVLIDMGDEDASATQRVCRFHDRVLELHESKVDQFCSMTPEEVKEIIQTDKSNKSSK